MPNPSAPRPMRPVNRTPFDEQVLPIRADGSAAPVRPADPAHPPCGNAGGSQPSPKAKWQAAAYKQIGYSPKDGYHIPLLPPSGPEGPVPVPDMQPGMDSFTMNQRITKAYADMYRSDPGTFKWAGMATLASREVGGGEIQSYGLGASPTNFYLNATEMEDLLAKGNFAVYNDIYWQLMAYKSCGLAEMKLARDRGDINNETYKAWQQIDAGKRTGNQGMVWAGNEGLLRYEQGVTLQKGIYDADPTLWNRASSAPVSWVQKLASPIPGDSMTFNQFSADHGFDSPSIGNFDQRWAWIHDSMLPAWQKLDGNPQAAQKAISDATNWP